jgi:uncharacterized protein
MAQDLFHYERMVEDALRGVVRDALRRAAREGLRSAHHFYIGFATAAPGVEIPDDLLAKYPDAMTIVLQHQFWDLEVGEERFCVTLSFQQQLERLVIPFAAIRSFADPSVNFALEFAAPEEPSAPSAGVPATIEKPAAAAEKTGAEVVTLDSFRRR